MDRRGFFSRLAAAVLAPFLPKAPADDPFIIPPGKVMIPGDELRTFLSGPPRIPVRTVTEDRAMYELLTSGGDPEWVRQVAGNNTWAIRTVDGRESCYCRTPELVQALIPYPGLHEIVFVSGAAS